MFRQWTLWEPRLIQTRRRALADAKYELAKVQRNYMDLVSRHDALHRKMMVVEEENMDLVLDLRSAQDGIEAFETALETGLLVYATPPDPSLAASPTSDKTMIGRQSE